MLSSEEYNECKHTLENMSNSNTQGRYNNIIKRLRKQLKEYEYSITYDLFTPLPYIFYFLNRTTSPQLLDLLIRAAQTTTEIAIDTESINIYKQCNKPALIQIQLIFSYNSSLIILVELYHLPRENHPCFSLMQQLFKILFTRKKLIYIWGSCQELIPFTKSKLFTTEQIDFIKYCNLQNDFKRFWIQHNPHQTSSIMIDTNTNCLCETCLGHKPSHLWSLQDSIALELYQYLPKTLTNERFNIGLDPNLNSHHHNDDQYCQNLTTYAMNDVLSMQQLINQMKNKKFTFTFSSKLHSPIDTSDYSILYTNAEHEPILEIEPSYELEPIDSSLDIEPAVNHQALNLELEPISEDDNTPQPSQQPQPHHQQLSAEQRKKIHNRTCTLKQRKRYYRHALIFIKFDQQFSIRRIKHILRQHKILFTAVNILKSIFTGRKILHVGIKDPNKLEEYQDMTQDFFSSKHFYTLHHQRIRKNFYTRRR